MNRPSGAVSSSPKYEMMPYDLLKEVTIALIAIGLLVLVLSAWLSTPDVPALTAKQVVMQDPALLVKTALDDLSHQDAISQYGPPYNNGTGQVQSLGFFSPQKWAGVQIPINSEKVNVIDPLTRVSRLDPALRRPLSEWNSASPARQASWVAAVQNHLSQAQISSDRFFLPLTPGTSYGPVPDLLTGYLTLARTGLLESAIDGRGPMPVTNRTAALLLLQNQADSAYAQALNMTGPEWGVIKETGNYPGAVWLWYYTLLYQIPPYNTSDSADLEVILTVLVVTGILVLTPFVPGLRDVPRWLKVYRLIWRSHYRREAARRQGTLR